jgi:hypothetical protein
MNIEVKNLTDMFHITVILEDTFSFAKLTKNVTVSGQTLLKMKEQINTIEILNQVRTIETEIKNSFRGWQGKTLILNVINGKDYEITTMKRHSGLISTTFKAGKFKQSEGYSSFNYIPSEDHILYELANHECFYTGDYSEAFFLPYDKELIKSTFYKFYNEYTENN